MQHTWFKDKSSLAAEFEADYGRRQSGYATQMTDAQGTEACGHKFKATNGWDRTTQTEKAIGETGLVGVVCCHGMPLRYLNIYGGGDVTATGFDLSKVSLAEAPDCERVNLAYDVACTFVAVLRHHSPTYKGKVVARIGRFHI